MLFALLAFALTMQSCYTEVVLPKHTVKKTKADKDHIVDFTYSIIDTFETIGCLMKVFTTSLGLI